MQHIYVDCLILCGLFMIFDGFDSRCPLALRIVENQDFVRKINGFRRLFFVIFHFCPQNSFPIIECARFRFLEAHIANGYVSYKHHNYNL